MASLAASSPLATRSFRSPARGARHALTEVECDRPAGMEENYSAAQSLLTQWRRDLTQSVGSEAQRSLRELCRERSQLADLRADLTGTKGLVDAAVKLHEDGEKLAETIEKAAAMRREQSEAVACKRDEFISQRDAHMDALRHESEEVEMQKKTRAQRQREIAKLLGTYHDRLGLTITRHAPQTVRMVFSFIDASDPAREFAFLLGLSESGCNAHYEVRECLPSVPELPALLAELNSNVDAPSALPRFVCCMRRAFSKLHCQNKL